MTVLDRSTCEECGRTIYERGGHLMIEAAKMASGLSPAANFLDDLERTGQGGHLADVLIRFEEFARTGSLSVPLQLKHLRQDIWQIKAVKVRLLFYYTEHSRLRTVRLTNGYIKRAQECPPRHIRLATRVKGDDVQR